MAIRRPPKREFNMATLQAMIDPVVVRVERVDRSRGHREPVPLPQPTYTREEVQGIEVFLVSEWCGGGYFEASATDAENKQMHWDFYYDEGTYPPRTPPPLQAAQAHAAPPPRPFYSQSSAWHAGAPSSGAPWGAPYGWGGGTPPWGGAPGWSGSGPSAREQLLEQRLLDDRERAASEARHRDEMRALQDAISDLKRRPDPVASETQRAQERELQRRDEELREERRRTEMREMQAASDRRFEELQRTIADRARGSEPMAEAIKHLADAQRDGAKEAAAAQREAERERAAAARDIAREQAQAQREATAAQLKLPDLLSLVDRLKPEDSGKAWKDMWAWGKEMLDTAREMGGPEMHPALQLLGQGLDRTANVLQQHFGDRAKVEWEKVRRGREEGEGRGREETPPDRQRQIAAPSGGAMAGAPATPPSTEARPRRRMVSPIDVKAKPRAPAPPTHSGDDWFGDAASLLPQVREAVRRGHAPERVVEAVVGAYDHFAKQKPPPNIPAFAALDEGRFGEFFDRLLPDAPQDFRARCAEMLEGVYVEAKRRAEANGNAQATD